jgi:hypothetical protein
LSPIGGVVYTQRCWYISYSRSDQTFCACGLGIGGLETNMKPLYFLAALAALATPASAQEIQEIPLPKEKPPAIQAVLPPPQYDHLFRGFLSLQLENEEVLKWKCDGNIACSKYSDNCEGEAECPTDPEERFTCRVFIASINVIRSAGYDPIVVFRHEVGHCNGWPSDHPNARVASGPAPAMWRREFAAQLREAKEVARQEELDIKKAAREAAKIDAARKAPSIMPEEWLQQLNRNWPPQKGH